MELTVRVVGGILPRRAVRRDTVGAYWMFGREPVDKLMARIEGKGLWVLFVVYLLPLMPDNLLTVRAGMTRMKFGRFIAVVAAARVVTITVNVAVAAGMLAVF